MKSRALRSLAVLLIAVFALALLPTSYANVSGSEQTGSQSRARRGKNGDPAKGSTSLPADPQETRPIQDERRSSNPQGSPIDNTSTSSTAEQQNKPAAQPGDQQPFGDGGQTARSSRGKQPPPFDRPPISSTSRSTTDQPSQPTYRPPQTRDSDSRNNQGGDSRTDSERDTRPAPTLERNRTAYPDSTSSRNADRNESGRERPVLRRPSDSSTQTSPRSQSPTANSPSSNQDAANDSQGNPDDEVVKLESTLVNIPILVSDRAGRYVPRLSKPDFMLYEDGIQQEIASFTSEEVPFNVVLLLDMSPSVQGSNEEIQDAAIAFVRQMRPQDRVMIASFDRRVQYHTDFTSDRRLLESAIRSTTTGSGTSVYDAVYETIERRFRNVEGRKALILFSDGEDTTSGHASYEDAVDMVSESDVLVYGLRYPGGGANIQVNPWPRNPWPQIPFPLPFPWPRRRRGPFTFTGVGQLINNATSSPPQWSRRGNGGDFMTDVATAGGGPVYDAQQIQDLSRLASQIADELRHTYTISYYPTNKLSNGGYRSIRIRVRNRDELAVRHRKGYNAGQVTTNNPTHTH